MLDASFVVANHFVHLCGHAEPPEPVLEQVQHSLPTLVFSILVTFIHNTHSMSHGDYKLHNLSQLAGWCMAVIEGSLIEHQLFPLSRDGQAILSVHIIFQEKYEILYFPTGDPIDCSPK